MAFLTTTASALSLFSQLFMLLSRMAKLFYDPQHLGIRDPAHCRNGADFHRLL